MSKVEVISVQDFMKGVHKKPVVPKKRGVVAHSYVYLNPAILFDPTVCIIGAAVLGLAAIEKILNAQGHYHIVSKMEVVRSILLPGVALVAIGYVLIHNPIGGWL